MITNISLANFKCFRNVNLDFADFNILAGVNGAGKSTILQSLLALRQSWESGNLNRSRVQLNGSLTELGTAREVYCAEPTSEFVELSLTSTILGRILSLRSKQSEDQSQNYFFQLDEQIEGNIHDLELFQEPFNYLHAERVGPRKTFPIPPDEGHPMRVGRFGENAPFIVASERRQERVLNRFLHMESQDGRVLNTLQYQWPLWMARLFPGFEGETEIYSEADQVRLGLALQRKQTGQGLFVRPTNTGFGVSFVLGVVVAGLVAELNTILLVENPEAHLHPRAQSTIGEFLARVAAGGTQVFVETHSEHVLNGMRRVVKQEILTPTKVRMHFFANRKGSSEPAVSTIAVSPRGEISEWPEGFFDQLDNDLSVILS